MPPAKGPYEALPESLRQIIDQPFTGDLDALVNRRLIRVGVTFNRTHYFIDAGQQRGLTYESMRLFEDELNAQLKTRNLRVHVVFVPMQRDQMQAALLGGKIDLVAAMITVTPEREKLAAFSNPTRTNVNQVVVTGPGAAPLTSLDDLAGREIFIRRSSLYHDSAVTLNVGFAKRGLKPVSVREAPEVFEDDDLLEMVNAGLVQATIVDDYLADFWKQVFTDLTVHKALAVRTGGTLAVAMRKENSKLRGAVNDWLKKHAKGDAFRNTVERRYLQNTAYAKSATSEAEQRKFKDVIELFRKYADQYSMDFLLMAAQGYQESGLNHSARSRVGAIGIMQIMPATGKSLKVGDIRNLEPNIHGGVKYMRQLMDQYFTNEPMDELNKGLMTFAAYNAGPGRVRQLRTEAEKRGLNANIWFGNVERVASERIGRETVTYVSNIYKYFVAYKLVVDQMARRATANPRTP